ncbi:competence type IV pilus assembly protein ComGB [Bacillus sp. FJAT-45350]|uniref:competence type IV pilus assembly protein ComGB n=1 Tax=Bacillus sp. FJAT-45350 TaxID=2011014 RepID=UPI000BB80FD5|nr:competence type IV pilus assembly protein ComGB [Bacillus sp. FJAT-45350]
MRKDKWKSSAKALFLKRLGVLLEQGYTITSGIELLSFQEKKVVKEQLFFILDELKEGIAVHKALETINIPKDIAAFLYFSERNSDLARGMKRAGDIYLKRETIKEKLLKLLRYPLFLLWIVIAISIVMVQYLFPHFQSLFHTVDNELPLITLFVLGFIEHIPILVIIIIVTLFVILVLYMKYFRELSPHKKMSIFLKIPVVNQFVTLFITYYFSLQLSGLLKGGMSIYDSLSVFEEQDNLLFYKNEAEEVKLLLHQGENLSDVMSKRGYYQKELALVIQHGQDKGQLDLELFHYSELLYSAIEEKLNKLLIIIQPSLFLIIGILVLSMFLSVLLPVFELINSLD